MTIYSMNPKTGNSKYMWGQSISGFVCDFIVYGRDETFWQHKNFSNNVIWA